MYNKLVEKLNKTLEDIKKNHSLKIEGLEQLRDDVQKSFNDTISSIDLKINIFEELKKRGAELKKKRIAVWKSLWPINWRYALSAPFIYGMFFPMLIFHIAIEIYHQICFRLYGIPTVNPREYFYADRNLLPYLNVFEKFNCLYCSYANCLMQYAVEIGARTERYWCPIKYAHKVKHHHSQYPKFVEFLEAEKFREEWGKLRNFDDIKKEKKSVN